MRLNAELRHNLRIAISEAKLQKVKNNRRLESSILNDGKLLDGYEGRAVLTEPKTMMTCPACPRIFMGERGVRIHMATQHKNISFSERDKMIAEHEPEDAASSNGSSNEIEARPVKEEKVEHPAHYGGEYNPYEVIKVLENWGLVGNAYLFNVVKYVARAGKKRAEDPLDDLKKAKWYLDRVISIMEEAKQNESAGL